MHFVYGVQIYQNVFHNSNYGVNLRQNLKHENQGENIVVYKECTS
jgi:hypothetical protein